MPHNISPTVTQVWKTGGQRYNPKLFDQAFTLKENKKKPTPKSSKKPNQSYSMYIYVKEI